MYDFSQRKKKKKETTTTRKVFERESCREKKCGLLVSHKKMRGF